MAIQNAARLQIEGKDTRIRMPSMTVRKSFKLFPGNGILVVVMATEAMARRLHLYCGEVGSGPSRFACRKRANRG